MSSNAIVYSIHSSNPSIEDNANFQQLRYSIDTLRKYNKDIDIKVYISPSDALETKEKPLPTHNIEYIAFDAKADPRLEHQLYALWTSHKWQNAFRALEDFDYENILYIDTDTFWQSDPEKIFRDYGNQEFIWTKADRYIKFIDFMKLKNIAINDGVNLLSKKMLKYKDGILNARVEKVLEWQEEYSYLGDYEMRASGIQWAACQYAVSEYLCEIGVPPKFFKEEDVAILDDYESMSLKERSEVGLVHYFNFATHVFLPQEYITQGGSIRPTEYVLPKPRDEENA